MGEKRTRTKFWCQNSQPYPNLPLVPPLSYSLAIHSPAENQEWQRIPGRTAPASAAPDIHVARRAGPQSRVPGAVRAVKPMVRRRTLDPVSIFDRQGVLSLFRQKGIKERHAETVWSYLGKHRERDVPLSEVRIMVDAVAEPAATLPAIFGSPRLQVPDVPASVRQLFAAAQIVKFTTRVVQARYSDDGEVVKLLIQLQTGEQGQCLRRRLLFPPASSRAPSAVAPYAQSRRLSCGTTPRWAPTRPSRTASASARLVPRYACHPKWAAAWVARSALPERWG